LSPGVGGSDSSPGVDLVTWKNFKTNRRHHIDFKFVKYFNNLNIKEVPSVSFFLQIRRGDAPAIPELAPYSGSRRAPASRSQQNFERFYCSPNFA
jgi:hypothetical protein